MSSKCCTSCGVSQSSDNSYTRTTKSGTYFHSRCKECQKEAATKWRANNPERHSKTRKAYYEGKGHEKILGRNQEWRRNNPDLFRLHNHISTNVYRARKRAASVELNPVEELWLDMYYVEAIRLEQETGIKHHVDHIKPISKGGLHAPWNLQVLTADENLRKGAKWHSEAA